MTRKSRTTKRTSQEAEQAPLKIRDRIKELKRIPASQLLDNQKNWRSHPQHQREALRGILEEIGFAGAELCYYSERNGGRLTLVDGHLRKSEAGDAALPCLITDLNDEEADKLLVTYDPIGAMAGADKDRLEALLRDVHTDSEALGNMLERLAKDNGIVAGLTGAEAPEPQIDRAAELQKKWGTEPGQLWTIASKTVPPAKVVKCPHCNYEQEIA